MGVEASCMARGVSRKCGGEGGDHAVGILGGRENHAEGIWVGC